MWLLTKILTIESNNSNAFCLTDSIDDIESLVFKHKDTGEVRLIPFDTCRDKLHSALDVKAYIKSRLDNEEFIGFYDEYLYCVNKYELKISDYFDISGVVKRKNCIHVFYASTVDTSDSNLVILNYNNSPISVMRLLLTNPGVFIFEQDGFYYELDDVDLAIKYTYSLGKENFDLALIKCRIAGKYTKAERKITNVFVNHR